MHAVEERAGGSVGAAVYEVCAVRYGSLRARKSHFYHRYETYGEPDAEVEMAYFFWVLRAGGETILVDTGFDPEVGARRGRTCLCPPLEALRRLGVDASSVSTVVVTHLHYDHAGNLDRFPAARFHLQDREMAFATGRSMCYRELRAPFDLENVLQMVRHVYSDRAVFHDGDYELAPGLAMHRVGGHSAGLQCARVWTRRGWVVLASDASHLYDNFEKRRPFPVVYNVAEMLEGFDLLFRLADSPAHIVPGHDPLVMKRYPAPSRDLEGIAVRLDVAPANG